MKKEYVIAELEIIEFTSADIVTVSDVGSEDGTVPEGSYDNGGWV